MVEDLKNSLKKYFSVGSKVTFVAFLLSMILSLTIYGMRKELIVNVDGNESVIVTFRSNVESILKRNGIIVGPKDKINLSLDSKVKNGDKIYIKKAVKVKVAVDGEELEIATTEEVVEKMLLSEGIELGEEDKVSPSRTNAIEEGMMVTVTRIDTQIIKESIPIEFATVIQKDDNLEKTVNKVVQEGETGEREVLTRVVLENGKEIAREVVSDVIKKEPVNKVLLQGTLGALNLSRGDKLLYTKVLNVKATAYEPGVISTGKSPDHPGYEITAMGTRAKRNPNGYSTIAVDPSVIPLGTKVYVEGYGLAIAEDTGGAIKGNAIDVYFPTYNETKIWGVRYVNVYILK